MITPLSAKKALNAHVNLRDQLSLNSFFGLFVR